MKTLYFDSNSKLEEFLDGKEYQEVRNGDKFWVAIIDGELIKCIIEDIFA